MMKYFELYLMCLAWEGNLYEISCGLCENFMEKFRGWWSSVCNDLWIQV